MHPVRCAVLAIIGVAIHIPAPARGQSPHQTANTIERFFAPERRDDQRAMETVLLRTPDPAELRAWHDLTASRPHRAGTEGDARVIEALTNAFLAMGLEVERHPFWALLAEPVSASVQIVGPEALDLETREPPVPGDAYSANEALSFGWNAYSGSGDVQGEVVYANYGRLEDFARLRELGVNVEGKVVLARFGGNFRGFKATFADEAGAAALLIFTDPADSGFARGLEYPDGGWANAWKIQRGSLKALPYPGDALTPGTESTQDADRLDPTTVGLPTIPVQPIGWGAAKEILARMTGRPVESRDWQGGLPMTYRLEGGRNLIVRVAVEQRRSIVRTENVVATLPGARFPEQKVIVGCHHDAWEYGAADPTSGLIAVLESARSFAEAVAAGYRPARSIVFAGWGAEEFGIIGSVEWVEANEADLLQNAVAYINLDGAGMGAHFSSSASPSLKSLILDAASVVPPPPGVEHASLLEDWQARAGDLLPRFGNLGGGSDHIGFYCRVGVPSAGLGMRGAAGDAYHSNYDNLAWYRAVVGEDYESARALTRVTNIVLSRLANADTPPLDPAMYAADVVSHAEGIEALAREGGLSLDLEALRASAEYLAIMARRHDPLGKTQPSIGLSTLERAWLTDQGLPGRPWFRNTFAATDPTSGYAAWMLPALRHAVEVGDQAAADIALDDIRRRLDRIRHALESGSEGSP